MFSSQITESKVAHRMIYFDKTGTLLIHLRDLNKSIKSCQSPLELLPAADALILAPALRLPQPWAILPDRFLAASASACNSFSSNFSFVNTSEVGAVSSTGGGGGNGGR